MKVMLFFLLFSSCISWSWTSIAPNSSSARLTSAALSQYLTEMKASFDWAPATLLVISEEQAEKELLQKRFGQTQVLVKNKEELQAYSLQHAGKTLLFITLNVEQENNQEFAIYVVNEGLKTVLKGGVPMQEQLEAPLGRACILRYDQQLQYQGIDCLLLSEDPEED